MSDKFELEEWTVLAFDMCSSSDIIEDLTLTGNLHRLTFVLNKVKEFVRGSSTKYNMKPYKFMGDGWLLLFPATVRGGDILQFATDLSRFFFQLSRARIERLCLEGQSISADRSMLRVGCRARSRIATKILNIRCLSRGRFIRDTWTL